MNKEFIEKQISELERDLLSERCTGRTQRIVNDCIERFFQQPFGTEVEIVDHYGSKRSNDELTSIVQHQLFARYNLAKSDYVVNLYKDKNTIVRRFKTRKEVLQDEINKYKKLLKGLNNE